jgi:hypothetical protein
MDDVQYNSYIHKTAKDLSEYPPILVDHPASLKSQAKEKIAKTKDSCLTESTWEI